jgi:hypothetical protein
VRRNSGVGGGLVASRRKEREIVWMIGAVNVEERVILMIVGRGRRRLPWLPRLRFS